MTWSGLRLSPVHDVEGRTAIGGGRSFVLQNAGDQASAPDTLWRTTTSHMKPSATLIFFCGKMAAGKSTLARELAERRGAVLFVQDELLEALFPGEITDMPGFLDRSSRVRNAITPHIHAVLGKGVSVVLDFPGNTRTQRAWFREIVDHARVAHELHYIDVSDAVCKRQLRDRSRHLPPGTPWTTDAEFDLVTSYFQPPSDDEGFNIIRHERPERSEAGT